MNDENAQKEGDLYIRSVCFSPDGKYLATGAEDKKIRVSVSREKVQERKKLTMVIRFGILLEIVFATHLLDMIKIFILWISVVMDVLLYLDQAIVLCGYGTCMNKR